MKYVITHDRVEIDLFARSKMNLRIVAWLVILGISLAMALTMPQAALLLYLFALLSLCAALYAYFQSRQKAVFDLTNKRVTVPKFLSTRTFEGSQIDRFEKVTAPGKSDYYVMLLKEDRHGQGYRLMPRYGGLFANQNKNAEEFEARILPVINQILY